MDVAQKVISNLTGTRKDISAEIKKIVPPAAGPASKSDMTGRDIVTKAGLNNNNSNEINWIVRRLHYLFALKTKNLKTDQDGFTKSLERFFIALPALISANASVNQNAFGTLYHAIEMAAKVSNNNNYEDISLAAQESLMLSVLGLHYAMVRAKAISAKMSESPETYLFLDAAIKAIFMENARLKASMQQAYNDLMATNCIYGNSAFIILGIFLDSYTDRSTNQRDTVSAYDRAMKNMYVPLFGLNGIY